jgi:hypothetical protein
MYISVENQQTYIEGPLFFYTFEGELYLEN